MITILYQHNSAAAINYFTSRLVVDYMIDFVNLIVVTDKITESFLPAYKKHNLQFRASS